MSEVAPVVSIGLALYNGSPFVGEAIESILGQTFEDFELIISDNASTDDTAAICRDYAARDSRIRFLRNERNLGAQFNQNLVAKLATGKYYKHASHNDKLAPAFLSRCVEVMEEAPEVVLCFSRMKVIDEHGVVKAEPAASMRFRGMTPHERLRGYFRAERVSQTLYGLIRTDVMNQTELGPWYGSDRALLQELALYGSFHVIDEPLFYFREHAGRSWFAPDREAWFSPKTAGRIVPGYWLHLKTCADMLLRAPIGWEERALCAGEFVRQGFDRWRTWSPVLSYELRGLLQQRLGSQRDQEGAG